MINNPIFTAQTSDGNSSVFFAETGGTIAIQGNFDGATVAVQASYDGGTNFITVPDASFTADTVKVFDADNGQIAFRLNLSSAGGSTSINATLVKP